MIDKVADYWNENIHDLKIAKHKPGTKEFYDEIYAYHFEKLDYLPRVIDYKRYRNKSILGLGCGIGIDLLRFAKNGAKVTGIDVAEKAVELAKKNFSINEVKGKFKVMDARKLKFPANSFDYVFAHGILQYTPDDKAVIDEAYRVLKPKGELLISVYNSRSWLNLLAKVSSTALEHKDSPVFRMYTFKKMESLLSSFSKIELFGERFPVRTRLHGGLKGKIFNNIFIPTFNLIPRRMISRYGFHIVGYARK